MASISSVAISLPDASYCNADVLAAGASWLKDSPAELALFRRFVEATLTKKRHFVLPLEGILSLNGARGRAEMFEQAAPQIALPAMKDAIQNSRQDPSQLGTFLFTSCTCPSIPAVDGILVEQAKLSSEISRVPIYQHGCAGGIVGLNLASKLVQEHSPVLLTSVELCSLVFQAKCRTGGQLVGSAIFGDGAASAVIVPENRGLTFVDSCSTLLPGSRQLMGYDIFDDGTYLRLDRELPSFLAKHVPQLVGKFLGRNGLVAGDVPWWLFHPGGVKILDFLEQAFSLEERQATWARRVLSTYGNLSSASVLFVLHEFLQDKTYKAGDYVLMVGVGPGLTIEQILFVVQ